MSTAPNHCAQFIPARDSRNRRIPGLYLRGDRYYAQLWVDVGNGKKTSRKFPLRDGDNEPVHTLSAAKEALEIKRHERPRLAGIASAPYRVAVLNTRTTSRVIEPDIKARSANLVAETKVDCGNLSFSQMCAEAARGP